MTKDPNEVPQSPRLMDAATTLKIEVFSDVVCPWCYIGKRRLYAAVGVLAEGADGGEPMSIDIEPRAFQLDPGAPVDHPTPVIDVYAAKFGGVERARAIIDQVTAVAAQDGLEFRLDRAVRANTLRAHRVIWWATQPGSGVEWAEVEEKAMAAYFTDGLDIGSIDTLADLAASAGADRAEIVSFLNGTDGAAEVQADLARAADLSITGVPTLVLPSGWAITGAQDADTLVRLLRRYADANGTEGDATSDTAHDR